MKLNRIIARKTNDYLYKIDLRLCGSCEASKNTIINKLNGIIKDLQTITKILDDNSNISTFENDNVGGNGYQWDYIDNK